MCISTLFYLYHKQNQYYILLKRKDKTNLLKKKWPTDLFHNRISKNCLQCKDTAHFNLEMRLVSL
jgi:hypothetical protein